MMQATAAEYRHRYLLHGLIFGICVAAPWTPFLPVHYRAPVWSFVQNGSSWFLLTNALSKPAYRHFGLTWDAVLVGMLLFAVAGAVLRVWGASYLGANTVQRGGMVSDGIIADGPFRYTRNPLYLGTLLHTVAFAFLMRPDGGIAAVLLIALLQFRLIGREEPYLRERLGAAYAAYTARVPRFWPSLRPHVDAAELRPRWGQGVLSEVYMIGFALTLATVGWSQGFNWESSIVRVMQGVLISLGVSVVARAFIPKATY